MRVVACYVFPGSLLMRFCLWMAVFAVLSGCSVPTERPAAKKAAAPVVRPSDETRRFPPQDRVKVEIIDNHLLGKDFLPGGNLAEYTRGGKSYQLFLIEAESPLAAALLMNEHQTSLSNSKFIPHMGGFFGMDGEQPVYIFAKAQWLAGLVGLPQEEADVIAREFAARL
jgi:hypothetical protein